MRAVPRRSTARLVADVAVGIVVVMLCVVVVVVVVVVVAVVVVRRVVVVVVVRRVVVVVDDVGVPMVMRRFVVSVPVPVLGSVVMTLRVVVTSSVLVGTLVGRDAVPCVVVVPDLLVQPHVHARPDLEPEHPQHAREGGSDAPPWQRLRCRRSGHGFGGTVRACDPHAPTVRGTGQDCPARAAPDV